MGNTELDRASLPEDVLRAYPFAIFQFRVENQECQLDRNRPTGQMVYASSKEPMAMAPRNTRGEVKQFVIANDSSQGPRIMTSLILAQNTEADLPLELVESILNNLWSTHFDELIGWWRAIEQLVSTIPTSCFGRHLASWGTMKVSAPVFSLETNLSAALQSEACVTFFLPRYVVEGNVRVPFMGSIDEKYRSLRSLIYQNLGISEDHDESGCYICRCGI